MASAHGYNPVAAMSPQGRWRRVLLIALLPMALLFLYYAYSVNLLVPAKAHEAAKQPQSQSQSQSQKPHQQSEAHPLAQPSSIVSTDIPHNASHATLTSAPSATTSLAANKEEEEKEEDLSMATVIKALYRPLLHPVDAANFTDEDSQTHYLAGEPRFRKKLGKKVLILDIDSRPLDGEGQLMNEKLSWKGMRTLSGGMLSHYMYAMIHGYDYKFIRAPDYADRWGTWVKVPLMKEALKTHDYIVFMDSDVMFHYPHLPLEWLLNYWNMTPDTLAMMSIDPDEPQNYDAKGNRYLNTGFVIAQQSPRTQEMFQKWAECPSERDYPGCAKWKLDWAHEQAAFGNYLRYDFNRPNDIKVLPCVEANGAPEAVNRGGCRGIFVRHFWVDKGLLAKGLADNVMQYFVPRLHQLFHEGAEENIMDVKKGFKLKGADLVAMTQEEKEEAKSEERKNQKDEGFKKKKYHDHRP